MERNTRQRHAIRAALERAGRPLLPREVLDAATSEAPGLSIATVYRTLKTLVDDGAIRTVVLPGQPPRYELTPSDHHHHHFQCRTCNRVFEVDACPGNLAALAPPGFSVEDHDLTLYGRCGTCADPRAVPAAHGGARGEGSAPPGSGRRRR